MITIFFGLLGGGLLAAAGSLARRVRTVRRWPTVTAELLARGVGDAPLTGGARRARFVPTFTAAYEVDGRRYETSRWRPYVEAMTAEAARARVDALPARPTVRFDPADPAQAFLEAGSLTPSIVVGVGGALALLGALVTRAGW